MPPSTHAKLSPSAAFRCLNCTPSLKMSEAFPNSTSVYAEEGTTAHELAEKKLRLALYEYADAEAAAALEREVDRIRKTSEYLFKYIQCCSSTRGRGLSSGNVPI